MCSGACDSMYGLLGTSSQLGMIAFFGRYFCFGLALRLPFRAQGSPKTTWWWSLGWDVFRLHVVIAGT